MRVTISLIIFGVTVAKHVTKWFPSRSDLGQARRSLLKMRPVYNVEFIWIMSRYNACKREDIEELIRTPSIRSVIHQYQPRINELIAIFPEN